MAQQPSHVEPYLQAENPVTRNPLEQETTDRARRRGDPSPADAGQVAGVHHAQEGVPTSRGHGVHGGGPVDAREAAATSYGSAGESLQNENVDAEQLATLGEGEVADAVGRKSGTQQAPGSGPAEEQDFASDLDRKKAEQAEAREAMKEARKQGVDVGGGAGPLGNESLADV